MRKKRKPLNFLKGSKVIIKKHVVERYMERAGVSYDEALATLDTKFRNSRLCHFKPDGSELRREISGSLNKRLTFVSIKKGTTFIVITCYLQGPKDNWWKNDGLIVEENKPAVDPDEITHELENHFQEVSKNG